MRRTPRDSWWVSAAVGLALMTPVTAPADEEDPVVLRPPLEERVQVTRGWRYHSGDDPAWADPAFDDGEWPRISSLFPDPEHMPHDWSGIGWFRRRVVLAPGMPATAVALRVEQAGASEVFLDGQPVTRFGTVASTREAERPLYPSHFVGVSLEPGVTHLIAVRYSNVSDNLLFGSFRGFAVNLRSVDAASAAAQRWLVQVTVVPMAIGGAFAAVALLHLVLFLFMPRGLENLVFAVFAATTAVGLALETTYHLTPDLLGAMRVYRPMASVSVAMVLAGLAAIHVAFGRRPGALTWVIAAAGLALAAWVWTWSTVQPLTVPRLFFLAGAVEILRVAVGAAVRREPEAWVIAVGFVPLATLIVVEQTFYLLGREFPFTTGYWVAMLMVLLAFSLFLSRRAARTSHELAARLDEVRRLSERSIEQERRAARDEAERRLLEVESARRARELEEARRLQLSMLPRNPPSIEGLDVAFRMVTATEVGGDYVDARTDADGAALLAVGDATSHGVHAGMVVAVAKSLFLGGSPGDQPLEVLHRVGAGLAAMHDRRASMTLAVLRFAPGRVLLASAGMPPLLVLRRGSTTVEEVLLPGVPLGTLAQAEYRQREVAIQPGDTLLVMTDGLVEATDADGEVFGYERAAEVFASLGGRSADEVVEGMLRAIRSFLAGRPHQDDITVVAAVALGL